LHYSISPLFLFRLYFASMSDPRWIHTPAMPVVDIRCGRVLVDHQLCWSCRECGCQIGGLQPDHRRDTTRESSSLGHPILRAGNDGITWVHEISPSLGSPDNASPG
jgi:hypothetical protein